MLILTILSVLAQRVILLVTLAMPYMRKMSSSNYQNKTKVKAMCPILLTYSLIEGRWKTHVMWAIRNRPLRFGEIRKAIPLATERMIARRVSELLEHNLIETVEANRIKTYRLSQTGKFLIPVLTVMYKSGENYQKALTAQNWLKPRRL